MCHLIPELNHFDSGDGSCINLLFNGDCAIYNTRPEICNNKRMYKKVFSSVFSWDEFLEMSEKACKFLESEMKKQGKI